MVPYSLFVVVARRQVRDRGARAAIVPGASAEARWARRLPQQTHTPVTRSTCPDGAARADGRASAIRARYHTGVFYRSSTTLATLALILTGCGSGSQRASPAAGTSIPRVPSTSIADVRRDDAYLLRRSYTPKSHVRSALPAGTPLDIIISVCTGSADGHCQAVDVFASGDTRPLWHRQYVDVTKLVAVPGGFAVTSARYGPQDPLCCPSGRPLTNTYRWSGHRFDRSGPSPSVPRD